MGKLLAKAGRHYEWARTEGITRLVEEDQLDPRARWRTARSKARWRRTAQRTPGAAVPLFIVGLQRSGTNMLVRGFEAAPEVEVHNENDRRAFVDFRIHSPETLRALVVRSRHDYVLFKPLCDSHRTPELLETVRGSRPGHAIWVYRQVDGRVRSSVSKFGDSNLRALLSIAAGEGAQRWEAGGLTADDEELLRRLPLGELSPESGAALFWYLRNKVLYTQALDERPDVTVVSYDGFLAAPGLTMAALCKRLDFTYRDDLVAGIERQRSPARTPLLLDERVRELCQDMQDRLDATARRMLAAA